LLNKRTGHPKVRNSKEESNTLMLYEVYASPEAFQAHWISPSLQQTKRDAAGLQVSLTGVRCDLVE
jgi:quinol monooxygenase YgiN